MVSPGPGLRFNAKRDLAYAVNVVATVTWLAGRPDYFDEFR